MTEKERQALIKGRENLYRKPLISHNPLWRLAQTLMFACLLMPIFSLVFRPLIGLKIKNREAIKRLRGKGFVAVCNHVYVLDSVASCIACLPRRVHYTSQEETMYIRGLRTLLRLLGAVPILKTSEGVTRFMEEMTAELKKGIPCVVYPEGELETFCDHLRPFKNGAFRLAHKADAPILPMVVTPRKADGLRRLFKREFSVTIEIGEPIMPDSNERERVDATRLKREAIAAMTEILEKNYTFKPKHIKNDEDAVWQVKKSKEI